MAQTNFNTSFPNDGLGDKLRDAFLKQQAMNTELYSTKVDKVAGKDLSDNNYSDIDKAKVDALTGQEQKNVQSDWNELDPTSDAFILGKPIFATNEIIVSAIWTGVGLNFNVSADAFPISGVSYPATPDVVTLDAAHATLDRIDLIVAIKPVDPLTVGTVGKITGTPASTALVVPPNFDPSLHYVIKQIIVRAAATIPDGAVNTQVYGDVTTWTKTLTANLTENTSDPSEGVNCIEAINSLITDKVNFLAPAPFSSGSIDMLTFDLKLKEFVFGFLDLYFYLGSVLVKRYYIFSGSNGYDSANLSYQTIKILKSDLNIDLQNIDNIDLKLHADTTGYYLDNVKIYAGSGAETVPQTGIPEAPIDGVLYGRKNSAWMAVPAASADMTKAVYDPANVNGDAFAMENMIEGATKKILTQAERDIINGLTSPILLKGNWDASVGTFPSGTLSGWSYIVSVAGIVDGVDFQINDRLISITDAASTTVYAGNWIKADYSDVSFSSEVNAASAKVTPVNADIIGLLDSAASFVAKKLTWANVKATLKTYFDTLYNLYVHPNHSGDVTSVADGATTIANNVVTNAKLATVATQTFKGRTTAATGNVEDLTIAQVKTMLVDRLEEDAAVTGTKNIDWGSYETFRYTLTGACIFSDTNLPTSGSKTITLHMDGNFAPTYPAGWTTYIRGTYDGAVRNLITVEYVKAGTPFYVVDISQPD